MNIDFSEHRFRAIEPWWSILRYILVMAVLIWLAGRGAENLGYNWQWYRVSDALVSIREGQLQAGPLLNGLVMTLKISGVSLLVSLVFGLGTALLRLLPSAIGRLMARMYLEVVRNIPLLILIFFIYFVLGPLCGCLLYTSPSPRDS